MTSRLTRRHLLRKMGAAFGGVAARAAFPSLLATAASARDQSLPPLPLKAGARVAFLGDSIIRRSHNIPTAREMSSYARGELFWASAYDQRFQAPTWYDDKDPYGRAVSGQVKPGPGFNGANQGLDSDHAVAEFSVPGTLSRVPYTAARNPDIVVLHIGTNDINSGTDARTVVARLEQNLAAIRATGRWTIISTVFPRSTEGRWAWPAGHRKWKARAAVNDFIRGLKDRDGVKVFDPNPRLAAAGAGGEEEWMPGFSPDGVHPGARAAQPAGHELAKLLATMIAPGPAMDADVARANAVANFRLGGTGGTKGAGVSGSVADLWHVAVASGGPVVACQKESAGAFDKMVLTVTPGEAGGPYRWETVALAHPDIEPSAAGLASGDWVQFGAYLEVAPWEGWVGHCCQISQRHGRSIHWVSYAGKPGDRTLELMPSGGFSGWWFSDPVQIVADVDRLKPGFLIVEVLKGAAGSGTIKMSRPFIRKVADPRPDWNL